MISDKLSFLSHNVRGIQASKMRLELTLNFRKFLDTPAGFVFL